MAAIAWHRILRCLGGILLCYCFQLQSASCCLSVSQPPPPAMEVKNVSVAVVGAGASGLASAAALFEAGVKDVIILEAADRIGGRINRYNSFIERRMKCHMHRPQPIN